jgi:uncharacterized phiE125 gp8 family phage protein
VYHRTRDAMPLRPKLIAPPSAQPVTLIEVKKQCRVDHSDDDDFLQALADAAVQRLDGLSGVLGRCMINQTWRFSARSWPAVGMFVCLPDVSGVAVKYRDSDDAEQTLAPTEYRQIETATGTLFEWTASFSAPSLFNRTDALAFDVTAGYGAAAEDVPRPLRLAILMLASTWYQNRETYSVDGGQELPFAVRQLIAGYRRNTV